MNTPNGITWMLGIGALVGALFVAQPAKAADVSARVEISAVADFEAPLAPYGRWEVVGSYGRCWVPSRIETGWRPYTVGYWEWTDCGWYWVSDEPWAWACYHYGRWVLDARLGWVWVPDIYWGPSWVSFREGDGYIGWAPLTPECGFDVSIGIVFEERFVPANYYVFVEHRRFREHHRPRTVVVNQTIVNKTVNITNITVENKTVINKGPSTQTVEKATGKQVTTTAVAEVRTKEKRPREAPKAAPVKPTLSDQPARQPAAPTKPGGAPARPAEQPQEQPKEQPSKQPKEEPSQPPKEVKPQPDKQGTPSEPPRRGRETQPQKPAPPPEQPKEQPSKPPREEPPQVKPPPPDNRGTTSAPPKTRQGNWTAQKR